MALNSTGKQCADQKRCDRNINLGLSLASLVKVLKACGSDDVLSLRALEKADTLTLMFESAKQDRVSEYELKLMDVDAEQLSIPEMEYDCTFEMSSSEFRQIVTNMSAISETGRFVIYCFLCCYFHFLDLWSSA
jgi:proliferating cell nuclear antigen